MTEQGVLIYDLFFHRFLPLFLREKIGVRRFYTPFGRCWRVSFELEAKGSIYQNGVQREGSFIWLSSLIVGALDNLWCRLERARFFHRLLGLQEG